MSSIAQYLPLVIVAFVVSVGYVKDVQVFKVFIYGAKKGIESAVSILPTLIGLLTAITMLNASGFIDFLINFAQPLCEMLNIPKEILPLAILRPVSGSGSMSAVINIFENHGVDSLVGQMASVLSASTETTFYAVSVYFAATNYKKIMYTIPVALVGDFVSLLFTLIIVNILN